MLAELRAWVKAQWFCLHLSDLKFVCTCEDYIDLDQKLAMNILLVLFKSSGQNITSVGFPTCVKGFVIS